MSALPATEEDVVPPGSVPGRLLIDITVLNRYVGWGDKKLEKGGGLSRP